VKAWRWDRDRLILALGTVVSLAIAGCGESNSGDESGPLARDSAGVAIVTNGAEAGGPNGGWTVAAAPSLDIGGGDKGPDYEFTQIVGVVRLADGRIAVANAGSSQVRFYGADGSFLMASGRAGEGPGEFQMIGGLWRGAGDSLLVADLRLQRLSVLDADGGYARALSLGSRAGIQIGQSGVRLALPQAWLSDGSIVGMEQEFRLNQPAEGSYRDTVAVIRFGPDGSATDTLGRFPGIEMRQRVITFAGRSIPTPSPVPLGRVTIVTGGGDRLFVATNDSWEIREIGVDGAVRRLIRVAAPPVEITEEDIEASRKQQLEQLEGVPQLRAVPAEIKDQMIKGVQEAEYPKALTFVAGMAPGPNRTLWVSEVVRPGDWPGRIAVFDSTGVLLGRVETPARLQVLQVGAAELLGIWRDPDGVEHVRAYPLSR